MVAEFLALLRAMQLCIKLGYEWVDFEGDALVVVNSINAHEPSLAWYGELIEDAKLLLS